MYSCDLTRDAEEDLERIHEYGVHTIYYRIISDNLVEIVTIIGRQNY